MRQPVRVVIDTQHRLTPDLALFKFASDIIIVRTELENIHHWPHFVKQVVVSKKNNKADLASVLAELSKLGLNDVFIEAGASLAGAFIEQGLVDELIHYQAPKLMGAEARSMAEMSTIAKLADAKSVKISNISLVGDDIRIVSHFQQG